MTVHPGLLYTLSALSVISAFSVAVLIAGSRPSIGALVELLALPALLLINASVLYIIACFSDSDDGGAGDGGTGKGGLNLPERPTGGMELDWETFEAEFRTYTERQAAAPR